MSKGQTPDLKVWVICEGRHEDYGALSTLIRRVHPLSARWELVLEPWKNKRGSSKRFRKTGKGDGIFKKFVASLWDAEQFGYAAVVSLIDQDRDPQRRDSVARAQESDLSQIPRAFGVAIESFDAWFLSDEKALSEVCKTIVNRQPDPERAAYPKSAMEQIAKEAQWDSGLAELYLQLARCVDLATLRNRCNKGFDVWASRLSNIRLPEL